MTADIEPVEIPDALDAEALAAFLKSHTDVRLFYDEAADEHVLVRGERRTAQTFQVPIDSVDDVTDGLFTRSDTGPAGVASGIELPERPGRGRPRGVEERDAE